MTMAWIFAAAFGIVFIALLAIMAIAVVMTMRWAIQTARTGKEKAEEERGKREKR